MKILFVYYHRYPLYWRDGLWAALNELEKEFEIVKWNLYQTQEMPCQDADFMLGWGAFMSPADQKLMEYQNVKKGLCIAGNVVPPHDGYDIYFYETKWYQPQLAGRHSMRAFGVNTHIFHKEPAGAKLFDYLTVGAFSSWKRQNKIINKIGVKLAVGEIQKDNRRESMAIVEELLNNGVMISDMVNPEVLAQIYRASRVVYIPASINGGGERAVWEARSCGAVVEIEADNAKLKELLHSPILTHIDYAEALKRGIYESRTS